MKRVVLNPAVAAAAPLDLDSDAALAPTGDGECALLLQYGMCALVLIHPMLLCGAIGKRRCCQFSLYDAYFDVRHPVF